LEDFSLENSTIIEFIKNSMDTTNFEGISVKIIILDFDKRIFMVEI
jgi:hypothetical protein